MKKETQPQIMKPIRVLSLVLLALLLLVPAASAESFTIVDTDLVFGSTVNYDVGAVLLYPDTLTYPSEISDNSNVPDGWYYVFSYRFNNHALIYPYFDQIASEAQSATGCDYCTVNAQGQIGRISVYYSTSKGAGSILPSSFTPETLSLVVTVPSSSSVTQHVTVTYNDETTDYTVSLERNGVESSAYIGATVLGFLPIKDFVVFGQGVQTSSEDWAFTLPTHFLWFEVDYTFNVVIDGAVQSVSWNLGDLPEGVTPPEPDPEPPEPDLPDEPDPPDPTEPPEEPPNPFGGDGGGNYFDGDSFRETFKLPASLRDFFDFDIDQIRSDLLADIPIFEDIAIVIFDSIDYLWGITLGFILSFLLFVLSPVYAFTDSVIYFIQFVYNYLYSFMSFLYIPNHILSYLVQFVPMEIVNFALLLFGIDVFFGLLAIIIPDIKIGYHALLDSYVDDTKSREKENSKKGSSDRKPSEFFDLKGR